MEKEGFFGNPTSLNWQSSDAQAPPELNSSYFNLNWDQSIDQGAHFESALSSLVSSPSSNPPASATADSVVIRELIGRLGSICNSGEISPPSHYHSTTNSCYSTPLNSPPKLNLSMMDHHQAQQMARGGIPISGNPSMPAAHIAPFATDPGFAERAARFSCFGTRNYGGLTAQLGLQESGKLSRVSSSQSLKAASSQMGAPEIGKEIPIQDGAQLENEMRLRFSGRVSGSSTPEDGEESSASDRMAASGDGSFKGGVGESNARKRKAASKGKGKEAPLSSAAANPPKVSEEEDSNSKRCRSAEADGAEKDAAVKPKAEQSNGEAAQKQGKEGNAKPPEPPKQDYIHVRARRGQATDSHSLAERVRREKISERMKFLQDLVPGCNKVTGKAVMLDEIINYVQSLQRQVEFLSMKLATVNPRLDFNVDSLIQKDMHQTRGPMAPHSVYTLETASSAFSYGNQPQGSSLQGVMANGLESHCSVNPLDATLRRTLSMQLPQLDGFGDATSQIGAFWEDDLQSVVQMGFGQNQETVFSSQSFQGSLPTNHMKIEL